MLESIASGYEGLKTAFGIVQGLNAANTQVQINDVKIALQQHILNAQMALTDANETQSAAAERIRELEAEIERLKRWSGERERYELKKFRPGALAYVLKPAMTNGEPLHMLCQHCYDRTVKGVLQPTDRVHERYRIFRCSSCKQEAPFGELLPDEMDRRLNPPPPDV